MEGVAEAGAVGEEPGTRKPPPGPRLRVRWQRAKTPADVAKCLSPSLQTVCHCKSPETASLLGYDFFLGTWELAWARSLAGFVVYHTSFTVKLLRMHEAAHRHSS